MCSPNVMAYVRQQIVGGQGISRRSLVSGAAIATASAGLTGRALFAQNATPGTSTGAQATGERSVSMLVDLTYTMTPDIPIWPGNEPFQSEPVKTFADDGFYAQKVSFWEHTGTHVDAPAHFAEGGDTAELLPIDNFMVPIAVIDISERAADDPDAALMVDDIVAYEAQYGELPAAVFVAMYSGWGERFEDAEAFVNLDADGVQHYPGMHPDAAAFLVEQRSIAGIGVDTLSQDPGNSTDFGTHITILGAGKYGVEGLANIEQVAPAGSTVFVGAPKHQHASGGPARIIAINPMR